jgi:hypothetical protein
MAERILEFAAAISIKLILNGTQHVEPRVNRAARKAIDVWDIEVDHDRRAPDRPRAQRIVFGKFIAQHDFGIAYFQFGMPYFAAMGDAQHFPGAKGLL